jgi:cytochrome b involved in lipid metabolism
MAEGNVISVEEISKHKTPEDCWIVVDGNVWDITEFAPEHPGGGESTHMSFQFQLYAILRLTKTRQ